MKFHLENKSKCFIGYSQHTASAKLFQRTVTFCHVYLYEMMKLELVLMQRKNAFPLYQVLGMVKWKSKVSL